MILFLWLLDHFWLLGVSANRIPLIPMGFFPYVPHENCPLEDILTGAKHRWGNDPLANYQQWPIPPIPIHSLRLAPVSIADFQTNPIGCQCLLLISRWHLASKIPLVRRDLVSTSNFLCLVMLGWSRARDFADLLLKVCISSVRMYVVVCCLYVVVCVHACRQAGS